MITTFALHPAASKYLIARAVKVLPSVKNALQQGKIYVGTGTGNIAVIQELLDIKIEQPETRVAGLIAQQCACSTASEQRQGPFCIDKGQLVKIDDWIEFVKAMEPCDLFIKGANALDPQGNVGILMADPAGGTIGNVFGILKARGIEIITPVGLEKLIPSCQQAEKMLGQFKIGLRFGMKTGFMVVSNSTVITEIESVKLLTGLDAVQVAAGGVGGMEGGVMLAVEYEKAEQAQALLSLVKEALLQPQLKIKHKNCADCPDQCEFLDT